jgi:ParB-like chromosome segregation protein Spo0J
MSRDIPIDHIAPHPQNANAMSSGALAKLERHIRTSGRYEPLVVRPIGGSSRRPDYQVLNGHHRLQVLRRLGHETARCEVWEVDDHEALMLLATLNRLEGRDDPGRRAALLAALVDGAAGDRLRELRRLLPENRAALEKALRLAREPLPKPAAPETGPPPFAPMTFFLTGDETATVGRALKRASRTAASGSGDPPVGRARAASLAAVAKAYLAEVEQTEEGGDP